MSIKIAKIFKEARLHPIPDIPISFPSLHNLHLEFLEVKDKLKSGLPLIPKTGLKKNLAQEKNKISENKPVEGERQEKPVKKENTKLITDKKSAKKVEPELKSGEDKELLKDLGEENSNIESTVTTEGTADTALSGTGEDSIVVEDETKNEDEFDIYAGLSPEERAIQEKEEYLWRFRILKKKYGRNIQVDIPEWNEFSDISMMKTSYERTIREIYLDDTVETYRTYLMAGWIAMEYACTELMEIDLGGFALQQISIMHKYDSLLIELGEKSCERWADKIPVEVRLIGMILFQAAVFYLGKIVSEKHGPVVGEMFRGFTGQPPATTKTKVDTSTTLSPQQPHNRPDPDTPVEKKERKMRGPRVTVSEIREKAAKKDKEEEPK